MFPPGQKSELSCGHLLLRGLMNLLQTRRWWHTNCYGEQPVALVLLPLWNTSSDTVRKEIAGTLHEVRNLALPACSLSEVYGGSWFMEFESILWCCLGNGRLSPGEWNICPFDRQSKMLTVDWTGQLHEMTRSMKDSRSTLSWGWCRAGRTLHSHWNICCLPFHAMAMLRKYCDCESTFQPSLRHCPGPLELC